MGIRAAARKPILDRYGSQEGAADSLNRRKVPGNGTQGSAPTLQIDYTPPSGSPSVPQKWNLIGKWADTAVTLATDFLDADADPRVKESLIAARTGAAYNGRAFGIPANNTNLFNALNFVPVANWGFETPNISPSTYVYHPTGASWTFSGAGLNRNGGPFSGVNAPEGYQCAFIQGTGYIEQSVTLAAGTYTISFSSIGRAGGMGPNPMKLYLDGAEVPSSSWTPATHTRGRSRWPLLEATPSGSRERPPPT